jgi:phosphoribosylamine--glycine ligase
VLASGGYPTAYEKGKIITGLDAVTDAVVFHAGTAQRDGTIVTNGGRVLGVTALGADLDGAIANAYAAAKPIHFDQMHFRHDIGHAF